MVKTRFILIALTLLTPHAWAVNVNGFTEIGHVVPINARVSGIVDSILVQPGQSVKQSDVLLKMDDTLLAAKVMQAKGMLEALKPDLNHARNQFERAQELYDRDSLTEVELANAEIALAAAEGKFQAAQAEVIVAEYRLSQGILKAPFDGYVLNIKTMEGRFVNPDVEPSDLLTVAKTGLMKAVGKLNSDQWKPGLLGKKATVKYKKSTFEGRVSMLGFERVEQVNGLPAYRVEVEFNTTQLIPAQMPVVISITD